MHEGGSSLQEGYFHFSGRDCGLTFRVWWKDGKNSLEHSLLEEMYNRFAFNFSLNAEK